MEITTGGNAPVNEGAPGHMFHGLQPVVDEKLRCHCHETCIRELSTFVSAARIADGQDSSNSKSK
eukprot:920099-Prorocentrum_minimum.AAC.1